MQGESIDLFVAALRQAYKPMTETAYSTHVRAMSQSMEREIVSQFDVHKAEILDLFPTPLAFLLKLSWAAMKGVASIIAMALVYVVLRYLATKTIEEVAELIVRHRFTDQLDSTL